MIVTLDQLQVLAELERSGSVSAAARRLHRAQSAVSYAIKTLEGALGLALVDHDAYRAGLTQVGKAVLAKAAQVLADAEALEHLAAELRGGAEPTLNILVDAILPIARIMPVLARFSERRPSTRVNLRVELLGGMVHALNEEQPELVVSPLGLYELSPHYDHHVIGTVTMVAVVAASHPLAWEPAPVSLETARRHVHLLITSPPGLQTPVDSGLIGAPRHWNFPDFASRLEGLRAGLGFAWMPTHMVEDDLRNRVLVPLVLERGSVTQGEVALLYRARPPLGPTGRYLLEELRAQAGLWPPLSADLLSIYEMP
ncbi:MAG TPA: LysR family transcriptional regulator [bacterium]|nr:LysR family transcriptional regulator [bacterium]